jgi:hypothetical protein
MGLLRDLGWSSRLPLLQPARIALATFSRFCDNFGKLRII